MKIAIGGISRAGKTTIARKILNYFPDKKKVILHQDDYVNAGYDIPQINERINWEVPESIDFVRLKYDFNWMSENLDTVILEGIFALYDEEMNEMFDKKLFVDLGYKKFIDRKLTDTRWGYEPDWYIQHIWDNYQKYREEILKIDDIVIIEENNVDACLDDIFSK